MTEYVTVKIGKEKILLACLKANKEKVRLLDCLVIEAGSPSSDLAAEAVRDFFGKNSLRKPRIINIFPSSLVMSKNIEIPSVDEKEIKEVIDLQATRHTPYARNEIVIDYAVTGVFHGRYSKIILVIGKKETAESHIALLKQTKHNPEKVILEAECIASWFWRSLEESKRAKPAALVHMGTDSCDFSVVYNKKAVYMRSLSVDKQKLMSMNSEAKEKFFSELSKSIEAYNSENIEQPPAELYFLSGAGIPADFLETAEKKSGIKCQAYSYQDSSLFPDFPENLKEKQKDFSFLPLLVCPAVLSGLELNLIPEDVKMRKEIQEKAKDITKIGIFAMLIIIIFLSYLFTTMFFEQVYLDNINQEYAREIKEADMLRQISNRTDIVKRFVNKKGKTLDALSALVAAMPDEVYFNTVEFKENDKIVITSTTDTMSRVFSLVGLLENHENFKEVKIDFTRSRVVGGEEIADFGITMEFQR